MIILSASTNSIKLNQTQYSGQYVSGILLIASLTLLLLGVVFLTACEAALDGGALAGQATRTEQSRCTKDSTGCKKIYNSCVRTDNCGQYQRVPRGETKPAKAERTARLTACQQGCYDKALSATFVPGSELCDGRDNDYDGQTDEGVASAGSCSTGLLGICASGALSCAGGTWQCTQSAQSSAELCNSLDDDCNGQTDDEFDLQTDVNNCGSCGNVCSVRTTCQAGVCISPPVNLYGLVVSPDNAQVIASTDWGDTWEQQTAISSTPRMEDMSCVGSTCFIVGREGQIIKSTDSGRQFVNQISGTTQNLYSVSCADTNYCVVVGDTGITLWTNNGGANWMVGESLTGAGLRGVDCIDVNNCIAVGSDNILKTTDGGATWSRKDEPGLMVHDGTANLFNIDCIGNSCWVVGISPTGGVYKSPDGGETWISVLTGLSPESAMKSISCVNPTVCFIGVSQRCSGMQCQGDFDGIVIQTGDVTPFTYTSTAGVGGGEVNSVYCRDQSNCYAGGVGQIWKTTNGGIQWVEQGVNLRNGRMNVVPASP